MTRSVHYLEYPLTPYLSHPFLSPSKDARDSPVPHSAESLEALPWAELPAPGRSNGKSATFCLVRCLVCRSTCYGVLTGGGRAAVVGIDGIAVVTTAAAEAAGTGKCIQGP